MPARPFYGKREEVRKFFRENPHEELTLEDLKEKFGLGKATAYDTLKILKAEGLIETVHLIRRKLPTLKDPT